MAGKKIAIVQCKSRACRLERNPRIPVSGLGTYEDWSVPGLEMDVVAFMTILAVVAALIQLGPRPTQ